MRKKALLAVCLLVVLAALAIAGVSTAGGTASARFDGTWAFVPATAIEQQMVNAVQGMVQIEFDVKSLTFTARHGADVDSFSVSIVSESATQLCDASVGNGLTGRLVRQ